MVESNDSSEMPDGGNIGNSQPSFENENKLVQKARNMFIWDSKERRKSTEQR